MKKKPERPESVKKPESIKKLAEETKPSPSLHYWWKYLASDNS